MEVKVEEGKTEKRGREMWRGIHTKTGEGEEGKIKKKE